MAKLGRAAIAAATVASAAMLASRSLTKMHADEQRFASANVPVKQALAMVRRLLGLPPPESS